EEFRDLAERGLEFSPVHDVLIEESVIGWKEFELEVMRDVADNFVVICSIENIDPMGVHTGDSVTVAPALTLSDKEYQRMRDAAIAIMRAVGVETGGANIQFAVDPGNGRMVADERDPRVARRPALASDKEYQRMRDAAIAIMRAVGVETGGSNIQFAVDPVNGRMVAIEMNPRVSRSSALASKATGFPIAKIATKLAIGYTLDEIRNDI